MQKLSASSSSYSSLGAVLGGHDGREFHESHQLSVLNELNVIDPRVFQDEAIKSLDINFDVLKKNLQKYNNIPGRPKIDMPWQVVCLLANGGLNLEASANHNQCVLDLIYKTYVYLAEDQKADSFNQNPLHLIALVGNAEVFDKLCSSTKGADSKAVNKNGCNVLGYAAMGCEDKDRSMLSHLSRAPYKLSREEFVDNLGNRLLHYLGMGGAIQVMIHFIKQNNEVYDVDKSNDEGFEPLHLLVYNGHKEAFEYAVPKFGGLQEYGATAKSKMNFAHLAAASGNVALFKFVIENFEGLKTALDANGANHGLHGVTSGNPEMIEYLNREGFGLRDNVDARGYGAIEYAIAADNIQTLTLLKPYELKQKQPCLKVAAAHGSMAVLDYLLTHTKLSLWKKCGLDTERALYPIQFAQDDMTREHMANIMVHQILESKRPELNEYVEDKSWEYKHKLPYWKGNVSETLRLYLGKTSTKTGSWIDPKQVEEFIQKIKHFDLEKPKEAESHQASQKYESIAEIQQQEKSRSSEGKATSTKTTLLAMDADDSDEASVEEGPNLLLQAIKQEMVKTLVTRARKSYEEREDFASRFKTDFVGEYFRFLHACFQHVNPEVHLTQEDMAEATFKDRAAGIVDSAIDTIEEKKTEFAVNNPRAGKVLNAIWNKGSELRQRASDAIDKAREAKESRNGEQQGSNQGHSTLVLLDEEEDVAAPGQGQGRKGSYDSF